VTAPAEALWLRAVRVADVRGLLPVDRPRLTPGELAAEVARRGEDRLALLVGGWYYPASYGGVRGVLSDEEAGRLVAALEAEIVVAETAPAEIAFPAVEKPPARHEPDCELCGLPLTPSPPNRSAGAGTSRMGL
jgi:hypothetical protein